MIPIYSSFKKINNNKIEIEFLIQYVKRMLPEYVFDTVALEGNPFTFPEVKTLLDGYTVGGHKLSDEQQILNLRDSWNYLISEIISDNFALDLYLSNKLHSLVARNEALLWGKFRDGNVSIAGTTNYICIPATTLLQAFNYDLIQINQIQNPVQKAIIVFLWVSYNKFYYKGNRIMARLLASGILISEGYGVFNISHKDEAEYNSLMIDYYNTLKADDTIKFLLDKCVIRIEK